ncbi:MAG: DedA family protein [bacterium]|nr:DedA family protein [bacterium]
MNGIIKNIVDIFLHLDKNLALVIAQYGPFTYGLLFLIIFMETGFVVTPFLPGDSLIFAAGALSVTSSLSIWWLYLLLVLAAVLGDTVNYWIGHFVGPKIFEKDSKFIKREYLIRTQKFYEKYGGQAIVLARFVPIIRTFAPFVAGVAKMNYGHFITYNITGGIVWVTLFLWSGYFFGNLPIVKTNFHYVIMVIIILSIAPIIVEIYRSKLSHKNLPSEVTRKN